LLGIPILTEPETVNSYFNLPRNTFRECVEQIRADVLIATRNLPSFYVPKDGKNENVPSKYKENGVSWPEYARVFGIEYCGGRMCGAIAEAILAQTYLLAASEAYRDGSGITWEQAAQWMAKALGTLNPSPDNPFFNPIDEMDMTGNTWYERDAPGAGENPKEILWRGDRETNRTLEVDHFPPTLFGNGRLNPTQNLVNAFPTLNGYPIGSPFGGYSDQDPYTKRDPRLDLYIIRNGSTAGASNTVIYTSIDDPNNNNALNKTETSTRTGYYMKKHLVQNVVANPAQPNDRPHYKAYIRYTELFLGYAEAANEAYGPLGHEEIYINGEGINNYSAYDVIKAIRQRAGITDGDAYLESIKGNQVAMRELIRNERRLELCFEGHRFWDLRRWKVPMAELTEPARGMSISGGVYTPIPTVEVRTYYDYMYHAPIPYSEVLKFSNLVQNRGWSN